MRSYGSMSAGKAVAPHHFKEEKPMIEPKKREYWNVWDGDVHIYDGRIYIDGEKSITIDRELTEKIIKEIIAKSLKAVELAGFGGAEG